MHRNTPNRVPTEKYPAPTGTYLSDYENRYIEDKDLRALDVKLDYLIDHLDRMEGALEPIGEISHETENKINELLGITKDELQQFQQQYQPPTKEEVKQQKRDHDERQKFIQETRAELLKIKNHIVEKSEGISELDPKEKQNILTATKKQLKSIQRKINPFDRSTSELGIGLSALTRHLSSLTEPARSHRIDHHWAAQPSRTFPSAESTQSRPAANERATTTVTSDELLTKILSLETDLSKLRRSLKNGGAIHSPDSFDAIKTIMLELFKAEAILKDGFKELSKIDAKQNPKAYQEKLDEIRRNASNALKDPMIEDVGKTIGILPQDIQDKYNEIRQYRTPTHPESDKKQTQEPSTQHHEQQTSSDATKSRSWSISPPKEFSTPLRMVISCFIRDLQKIADQTDMPFDYRLLDAKLHALEINTKQLESPEAIERLFETFTKDPLIQEFDARIRGFGRDPEQQESVGALIEATGAVLHESTHPRSARKSTTEQLTEKDTQTTQSVSDSQPQQTSRYAG